jgi:hypothetical protein
LLSVNPAAAMITFLSSQQVRAAEASRYVRDDIFVTPTLADAGSATITGM